MISVIVAGVSGPVIAVLDVGSGSLKAASANPVDSLENDGYHFINRTVLRIRICYNNFFISLATSVKSLFS
jgi:hypothetical protein